MGRKRFACIRQHDWKDCGPACLAMISRHYGLDVSIAVVREIAGTDLHGTNVKGLLEAAERLGFQAKGVKATNAGALNEIPLPAIAHVIVDGRWLHYVVVYKVKKKKVFVADPAKGLVTYPLDDFCGIWTRVLVLLTPSRHFQRGKMTKSTFSRFWELLKPQTGLLLPLFFASVFYNLFGLLGAFYFKLLIDDIVVNQLAHTLHIVSVGIIVLYVFKVLLSYFRTHLLLHFSRRIDMRLMLGYYRHVIGLPMNFFETRKVGEIISRFMDASKVRDALSTATVTLMIDTLMVIAGAVLLLMQSPVLFGITLLLLPFYAAVVLAFHKSYQSVNHEEMESNAKLTSYMVESLNGITTVKSFNGENEVFFQTESRFVHLLRQVFRRGMLTNLQSSIKLGLEWIGGIVILWVGAGQVLKGKMTIGELITFHAILGYFLDPIENLIQLQPTMQSAVVAAERLHEIFDLNREKDENEQRKRSPVHLKGKIEVRDVSFRYGSRRNVLNHISFSVEPESWVAFVGESGSGKSTIAKLLLHFYEPQEGDIYYGRYHIKEIKRTALRDRIAYVPQESFFFSGSVYDNLRFGLDGEVPLEDVIAAAKQAQAHDFISELPLRYETILEENGANLSGGQRQRLAIARALLKKPDILILDEATSQLDATTEKAVIDMLNTLCDEKGMTVMMIAHRLSTIRNAHRIFVMKKGEIIEQGSHDKLLRQRGEYYRLWRNQTVLADEIEPQSFSHGGK